MSAFTNRLDRSVLGTEHWSFESDLEPDVILQAIQKKIDLKDLNTLADLIAFPKLPWNRSLMGIVDGNEIVIWARRDLFLFFILNKFTAFARFRGSIQTRGSGSLITGTYGQFKGVLIMIVLIALIFVSTAILAVGVFGSIAGMFFDYWPPDTPVVIFVGYMIFSPTPVLLFLALIHFYLLIDRPTRHTVHTALGWFARYSDQA